ncbi:MAG: chromophore lyase CpcT/CpeT [Aureispira sp.]
MRILIVLFLVGLLLLMSCGTSKNRAKAAEKAKRVAILSLTNNLEQLGRIMPGIYTNSKQYQANQEDFYHVIMKLHRIWEDRDDAIWMYIEQAQFDVQDHPYRQRIYKVFRGERDTLISEVYTLPDPKSAIGKGDHATFWKDLAPTQLTPRAGCAVYLTRQSNALYVGGTRPNTCLSSMAGASFAHSTVTIGLDIFESLDQGFDKEGKLMWGSEKGAYSFEPYQEE